MAEALFSTSWYRVAGLTPRLRSHARIHRHRYRGETWYVLQDLSSERFHRFTAPAHLVMGLMDGQRTVQQIWDLGLDRMGDDALTQDEMIRLLGQLHTADVLQCDVPPDTAEIFRRGEKQRKAALRGKLLSIFSWQIPLYDPERLLVGLLPLVRPFFGWGGLLLWLAVVGTAGVLLATHWQALSHNMLDRVLLPENLLLLWLVFPMVKLWHEFGHAFAVKAFGGEVHEMGVMMLVLTPVPYVDASSSWAFRSKWRRVLVGGAGMAAEVFLASFALFLWLALEPGPARALMYNVVLLAGVSTVIFNANPLLRFDGYYMLMDYLEIPNLRGRATQYLIYLWERYPFGRKDAEPPQIAPGERAWFIGYSVGSFLYRMLVILAILFFLGERSLLLGLIFAALTAFAWLVQPVFKIGKFVFRSPRLRRVRRRAIAVTLGLLGSAMVLITLVPAPLRTMTEGVVWVPEEGLVRARADGFIAEVVAADGSWVKPGQVLVRCEDRDLEAEVASLAGRVRELDARLREQQPSNRVKAQIITEERRYAQQNLADAEERLAELTLHAGRAGVFLLPQAADLPGRFLRKGQVVAHVVRPDQVTVRAVVTQQDIDLVRGGTEGVQVRLAEDLGQVRTARLARIVPAAGDELPSPALGTQGGGPLPPDPNDPEGHRSLQRFFQVDLELPSQPKAPGIGGHAYVRFDHGVEPLGAQWYRHLRQLFLARLNV